MNCDECKHFDWYYERCRFWNCKVDLREVHNCFVRRETPIRDAMVNSKEQQASVYEKPKVTMIWRILIITKDYSKYVEYFSKQYEKAQRSKTLSRFESTHTYIEIRSCLDSCKGQKFNIVYADKSIIEEDEGLLQTLSPATIDIKHLRVPI